MLPSLPQTLLLVLLHAGRLVTAQRRGGGGGGGGGGDNGAGELDDIDIPDTPTPPKEGPPKPQPTCEESRCVCAMIDERTSQYELPGMYYNGTVTVEHKIDDSSVWLFEDTEKTQENYYKWCGNKDGETKTYEYPALLFVGNTGNDSDTNPIFWILRGYQPADQTDLDTEYLDVRQRWIHLRSSDFVVRDESRKGLRGQYRYLETDATAVYGETSVYWRTNISDHSEASSSFSARATYEHEPILTEESGEIPDVDMPSWDPDEDSQDVRTSQYVTLSDVCNVLHQTVEGASSAPGSSITEGDEDNAMSGATTPTVWLPLGTVAEMSGIGSETARFELTSRDWERVRPYASGQSASCFDDVGRQRFEWSGFSHMHRFGQPESIWNLTLSLLSLSFEGSLVGENSTDITSFGDDGTPVFGAKYERAPREEEENPPSSSGDGEENNAAAIPVVHSLVAHLSIFVVVIGIVHSVAGLECYI